MKYECEIDKILDAVIDVSTQGVPIGVIVRSLIKNVANNKCKIDEIKKEFEEFKALINEEEDDE
jgi:hypothetical protein